MMKKNMTKKLIGLAVIAALNMAAVSASEVTGLTTFTSGTKAKSAEVNGNFDSVKSAVDDNDSRISAVESENITQNNLISSAGGIVKVMTAASWDADYNQPVVNQEWFWLDNCLTEVYTAGAGETALVTATMGIDFVGSLQGEVMVSSFPNGAEPTLGQHQRYFCRNCSFSNITVMDAIPLTQGVTYQFGPVGFLQGSGPDITRLACQTMVQVVKVQP